MKKISFLTTVILFALALILTVPNKVLAAPSEGAQLKANEVLIYDETGETTGTVAGATYDLTTNKLTLNNFNGTNIEAIGMGSDFKIEVLGTNILNSIYIEENPNNAMPFQDSVEFMGEGNLNINIEQGFTGMAGIHSMGDIIINDVSITIISNANTAQRMNGINADNSLKVNSGTVKISGDIYIGMISGGGKVIINEGTITVSAKELAIGSPTGITINGGLLTLTSDEIAIHSAYDINIKGGKIVLNGKICAILAENIGYEPNIILDPKMELEEDGLSIIEGTYNDGYAELTFQSFGKDVITFDPQTREYKNAAKKVTIKEKNIEDEVEPEIKPEQNPTDTDKDKENLNENSDIVEDSSTNVNANINTSGKDDTPKTGSPIYSVNIIAIAVITLLGTIVISKEN